MPLEPIDGGVTPNQGEKLFTAIQKIKNNFNYLYGLITAITVRTRLTANSVITVGAGQDFATLQEAWDYASASIDTAGFKLTFQLITGTLAGVSDGYVSGSRGVKAIVGGGPIVLNGVSGTIVQDSADISSVLMGGNYITVQNFEVRATGAPSNWGLTAALNGVIIIGPGMRFGACTEEHMHASSGGQIHTFGEAYSIVGGGKGHAFAGQGGQVRTMGSTVTITGTPAFSEGFAFCGSEGIFDARGSTYTGSATGKKFSLETGSRIIRDSNDLTDLPGSLDGTLALGAWYDDIEGLEPSRQFLTDAANISWDARTQPSAVVLMEGNRTLDPLTNVREGLQYRLGVVAIGADRTITFDAAYLLVGRFSRLTQVTIPEGEFLDLLVTAGEDEHTIDGTPSWPLPNFATQTFTSSGTYTPTPGMKSCKIRVQAPGGGSGGADGTGFGDGVVSAGGGGGEYAEGTFTAADIGASKAVTIGAVGAAGSATGGNGGTGGTTSVAGLITCIGGGGGTGTGSDHGGAGPFAGGAGGTGGTGGTIRQPGQAGGTTEIITDESTFGYIKRGKGGDSAMGHGVPAGPFDEAAPVAAVAGPSYGAGATGGRVNSNTGIAGAVGGIGVVIIEEFF